MTPVIAPPAADAPHRVGRATGTARAVRAAVLVAAWVVVTGVGLVVLAAVVVPRVTGAQPYTILSGSMEPTLGVGDVAVVRPTDPEDVVVGDVVTYQVESGRDVTVTHRVVALGVGPDGDRLLITQGDANDVPDVDPVRPVQVRGTLWYAVPVVGQVVAAVDPGLRVIGARVLAGLLLAYACVVLLGGLRRDADREAPAEESP